MGKCVFCEKEEKLTSEHVWGKWIRKAVPLTVNKHHFGQLTLNRPGTADENHAHIRAGDPVNAQAEILCANCNNKELGKIQENSIEVLQPLLNGESYLLNSDRQKRLAQWATMATMTAEFLNKDDKQIAVSLEERKAFLAGKEPPAHWSIWIGHYRRWRFPSTYVHTSLPILSAEEAANLPDKNDAQCNMQTTSIMLGGLFVHVIGGREIDAQYVHGWDWRNTPRASRLLVQIWPPKEEIILFPFPMMTDIDARDCSTAFFNHLHNIAVMSGV